MRKGRSGWEWRRRAGATSATVAALVALSLGAVGASPEVEYEKQLRSLKAADVVSLAQYQQVRLAEPTRALQLSGSIQGVMQTGEQRVIILSLVDGCSLEVRASQDHAEMRIGSRVRCLVRPRDGSLYSALDLVDMTWDRTPVDVLAEAARAALKLPVKDKQEVARSAAELRRQQQQVTARGGDPVLTVKRAIASLNPRLSGREIDAYANAIFTFCDRYGLRDPYLVVAVIAAESRFNPNARSHKGAAGLGQLMPATAAAHGVDPYDPVANLEVAVRILKRNLDKYDGDILKALAAYNAGTGAVKRYGGVPPFRETRNYLWTIYEYWCWLRGEQPVKRPQ